MSKHNATGCSFIAGCIGAGVVISLVIFTRPGNQASLPRPAPAPSEISNSQIALTAEDEPQEPVAQPAAFLHGPDFADFPADDYDGILHRPDFQGRQRSFRSYRTRISEAVDEGPVFAGNVALAVMGCGTDCSMGYAIDLDSGNIVDLPVGGERTPDLALDYRRDSRLLKAAWLPNLQNEHCTAEAYYQWNGTVFTQISSTMPDCGQERL